MPSSYFVSSAGVSSIFSTNVMPSWDFFDLVVLFLISRKDVMTDEYVPSQEQLLLSRSGLELGTHRGFLFCPV